MARPAAPHLTPLQRKKRYGHNAEVALWRTTLFYAQTREQRNKAIAKLRELGIDPFPKGLVP